MLNHLQFGQTFASYNISHSWSGLVWYLFYFLKVCKNLLSYQQLEIERCKRISKSKVHLAAQLQQLLSTQSHAVTSVTIYPRRTGTGTHRSNNIDIRWWRWYWCWFWLRWHRDVLNFEIIKSKGGRCETTATWGLGGHRGWRVRNFPRKRGFLAFLYFCAFVFLSFSSI